MDSFIVEDQRVNPPVLLNPQRIALVPTALKDGTKISAEARIAWAGHHHSNDPATVANPEKFDPLRSCRKRHSNNGANMNEHTAGQTDSNSLSSGTVGSPAQGEGASRPKLMFADENVFMDPNAKLPMRKRKQTSGR